MNTNKEIRTKYHNMAQAIDSFSDFMPTGDVKVDLIEPVRRGECTFEEKATEIADYIWKVMNYDTNPQWIRENGLAGKKQYYPQGNWIGNRLYIDVEGEDKELQYHIKQRLMNFENMLYEDYLLNTLNELELFNEIEEADAKMDKTFKIDLIAKDGNNDKWYISVYKSSDSTALGKLNSSPASLKYKNRLSYNIRKSGDPRKPENVQRWFDEIIELNKHIIFRDNNKWLVS